MTFVSGLDHCCVLVVPRGISTYIKHVLPAANNQRRARSFARGPRRVAIECHDKKSWILKMSCRTSMTKSYVWKTQMKGEEQATRVACNKATRTHRVVEMPVFEDLWNRRGRHSARMVCTPLRRGGKIGKKNTPERGGQHTNRRGESSPVTDHTYRLARQEFG